MRRLQQAISGKLSLRETLFAWVLLPFLSISLLEHAVSHGFWGAADSNRLPLYNFVVLTLFFSKIAVLILGGIGVYRSMFKHRRWFIGIFSLALVLALFSLLTVRLYEIVFGVSTRLGLIADVRMLNHGLPRRIDFMTTLNEIRLYDKNIYYRYSLDTGYDYKSGNLMRIDVLGYYLISGTCKSLGGSLNSGAITAAVHTYYLLNETIAEFRVDHSICERFSKMALK